MATECEEPLAENAPVEPSSGGVPVSRIRLDQEGFSAFAAREASLLSGTLLFNVRVINDPSIQRIAALRTGAGRMLVLAQAADGASAFLMQIGPSFAPFIEPLARWHALPLSEQADTRVGGQTALLVGALRASKLL